MRKTHSCIFLVVLALGALFSFPCLGMIAGVGMFALESAGQLSKWELLGAPPETPSAILAGDTTAVYLVTQTDRIYGCQHNHEQTCRWFMVDQLPQLDSRTRRDSPLFEGKVPPPPGTVVSELNVTKWGAETAYEARYVLLADGTVWKWEYSRLGFVELLSNLLVGLIVGTTLGVLLAIVIALIGSGIVLARRLRARDRRDA